MKKPNLTLGTEPKNIADRVVITVDPLTAMYTADKYLKDIVPFNEMRNYPGYTGTFLDKKVTVIAAGVGMASLGMLAADLYENYRVQSIVYAGLCDGFTEDVAIGDCVLVTACSTDSNYPDLLGLPGAVAPVADFALTNRIYDTFMTIKNAAFNREEKETLRVGPVLSSDRRITDVLEGEEWTESGALAADTATAALFVQAQKAGKPAAALLLTEKNLSTGEEMTAAEIRYKPPQYPLMRQLQVALQAV